MDVFTFEAIHAAEFAKSEGKKEMARNRVRTPHGMRREIRENCWPRLEVRVFSVIGREDSFE